MTEHANAAHGSHGNTVAAWTMVGVLIVAAFVMSLAVVLASVLVFVIGAVLAVLGVVAGKVLSLAGYGSVQPSDPSVPTGIR